jgi:hypothetical protein
MFVVISNYDFADNLAPKFHYPKEIERKIKKESTKHLGSFTTYTDKNTGNVRIYKDEPVYNTNSTITIDKLEGIELSDISAKNTKFSDEINDDWELV